MKYFSHGKVLNLILTLAIIQVVLGLCMQKIKPEICEKAFIYGGWCFVLYLIYAGTIIIVIFFKSKIKNNEYQEIEINNIKITISQSSNNKRIAHKYHMLWGFILGVLAMVLGQTLGDHFHPNPYFYWSNLAPIIWWCTGFYFLLQVNDVMLDVK